MKPMTLADYNERILEPAAKALEAKLGKPRHEIIADCERQLQPFHRVMALVAGRD